jgi:PAS domain S-box-containing protein
VHWGIKDDSQAFWLYTACGLARVARSEVDAWAAAVVKDPNAQPRVQATVFDNSDGVRIHAAPGGYTPQVGKSPDGRIWFLPWDGVSVIDPRHLPVNPLPPPVQIERLTADGQTYDPTPGLRLPPLVRDLSIDYTALSLVAPEKIRFRYKLEGQDPDWKEVVSDRRVQYSNLAPGPYRFRVTATNNSGVWSEAGASLAFAIAPAFYQTNWFRAVAAVVVLGVFAGLHQLRIRQVQLQEATFREAIETMPAMAFVTRPDGGRTFVNRRWVEYTGLTIEQAAASEWQNAIHPGDLERVLDTWRESLAVGRPVEYEVRLRGLADGAYRWFLTRAVPVRDKRGRIVNWYGVATDIEDHKRVEQEREKVRQLEHDLAHVNRVSMLGQLAVSLSHELKQPIAAAMTNAATCVRWLAREQPDVDEAREAAKRITTAGARAAEIIDRLRSFYRKGAPLERELVDVNALIGDVLVLLRGEANRYSVSMHTDLASDLPPLTADPVQLQQVLMNLMLNGIEAMQDSRGTLTVTSRRGDAGYVVISVSDTGVGLPAVDTEQMFSPFFTSKPEGSGMGLAISRTIIESHGGRLWATANAGRGATFHFTLPAERT